MTASTLLHWQVLSKELGTVQTGTGKVDPARKFKCTPAARVYVAKKSELENQSLWQRLNSSVYVFLHGWYPIK